MTVVRIHVSPQSGRTPDDPEGGSPELTVCAVRYHMRLSESSLRFPFAGWDHETPRGHGYWHKRLNILLKPELVNMNAATREGEGERTLREVNVSVRCGGTLQ